MWVNENQDGPLTKSYKLTLVVRGRGEIQRSTPLFFLVHVCLRLHTLHINNHGLNLTKIHSPKLSGLTNVLFYTDPPIGAAIDKIM